MFQSKILQQSGSLAFMSMSAPSMDGRYPSSATSKRGSFCRVARVSGVSRHCPANQEFSGELCNLQRNLRVLWYRGDVAASSSVVAFLIQNVAIAHPKDGRFRLVGIGMVVASLFLFAVGITVAANALGNLIGRWA
jgi:hypothetical protein